MMEIKVTRQMQAEPKAVWDIIGDFGNLSWVPGPEKVEVIGSGVGMIRRLTMAGMDPFDEVLQSMDARNMTLSYVIPKNDIVPFDDYVADITVSAAGDGGCEIVWHSCFDNGEIPEAQARRMLQGSYDMMLDALASRVERQ